MSLLDKLLDWSIYFSFDESGFKRHAKNFIPENWNGSGKTALVTGANKGIGLAAAKILSRHGVHVILGCRSKERGEAAVEEIRQENPEALCDLFLLDVGEIPSKPLEVPPLDILVHNAGGMPDTLSFNSRGEEIIWATHVLGPLRLTKALPLRTGARVIFVSSGGMYLQKLDLSDLKWEKRSYDKYTAYANAKRAQVILTELLQEKFSDQATMSCMHPGWVDTEGVEEAMPSFYRWTKNRLRTPAQGADTIAWLSLTDREYPGGRFWFDRKEAPRHKLKKTKESHSDRKALEDMI